jgi:hypothetical protein
VSVALVTQHAKRMCHIVLLVTVWLYHIFQHYLINGTIFGEKDIGHKMCGLIFSTTFA